MLFRIQTFEEIMLQNRKINPNSRRKYICNTNILLKNILNIICEYDSLYGVVEETLYTEAPCTSSIDFSEKLSLFKIGKDTELITWTKNFQREEYKLSSFFENCKLDKEYKTQSFQEICGLCDHILLPNGSLLFLIIFYSNNNRFLCLWDKNSNSYEILTSSFFYILNLNYTILDTGKLRFIITINNILTIIEKEDDTIWKIQTPLPSYNLYNLTKLTNKYFVDAGFSYQLTQKYKQQYINYFDMTTNLNFKINILIPNLLYKTIISTVLKDLKNNNIIKIGRNIVGMKYYIKNDIIYIIMVISCLKGGLIILLFKFGLPDLGSDINVEPYKCGKFELPWYDDNIIQSFRVISDNYILVVTSKGLFQIDFLEKELKLETLSLIHVSKQFIKFDELHGKIYFTSNNQLIYGISGSYVKLQILE